MNKQKIVVGYCRAACANQPQIDRQKKLLKEHAKKQNLHIKEFYIDSGQSGATLERPEFERLLKDCKAGKIQKVFVTEMDRLARDMCLVTKAYEAFGRYNVKVWVGEKNDLNFLKTVPRAVAEMPV